MIVLGCQSTPSTLKVKELLIEDDSGKKTIRLGFNKGAPVVELNDLEKKDMLRLMISEKGPTVVMFSNDKLRLGFVANGEMGAGIHLMDATGMPRCSVGAAESYLDDGTRTQHPESHIVLWGPDGKSIWEAPTR
jgi:hypothetical protein